MEKDDMGISVITTPPSQTPRMLPHSPRSPPSRPTSTPLSMMSSGTAYNTGGTGTPDLLKEKQLPSNNGLRSRRRKQLRLKPSQRILLKIANYILPLLNLGLLSFIVVMTHAYIFPTASPTSLPLRLRGSSWFKMLYVVLCIACIAIGCLNVIVVYQAFKDSARWRFWKKFVFPCEMYISPALFRCFPRQRTMWWPWKRPGGMIPLWKVLGVLGLGILGIWGLVLSLGFRDFFAQKSWDNACGEGNGLGIFGAGGPGWEIMAEIRVLNEGNVQYNGEPQENEKWGTSSRISFYTRGKKWDYDMDLVRRYDMPFGFGDWADGRAQRRIKEAGEGGRDSEGVLVLALHNFLGADNPNLFKNMPYDYEPRYRNATRPIYDLSPFFPNSTNLNSSTSVAPTTTTVSTFTYSPTPTASPSPLSFLKHPYLSTADRLASLPIMNPFPIYAPPSHQPAEQKYHSLYPPIQKIVYNLSNMTYWMQLTNTTAPGFPAIEERGGFELGRIGGKRFGVAMYQGWPNLNESGLRESDFLESSSLEKNVMLEKPWMWKWDKTWEMDDGVRWRWDDYKRFMGRGTVRQRNDKEGDLGVCLPPRVRLRSRGLLEDVLATVGVMRECGVVRVCGVRRRGGVTGKDEYEDILIDESGRELGMGGDEGWESGGWKRDIEDRWAVVVGLLALEVERWGRCCLRGE